jgi:hypothetical protein
MLMGMIYRAFDPQLARAVAIVWVASVFRNIVRDRVDRRGSPKQREPYRRPE